MLRIRSTRYLACFAAAAVLVLAAPEARADDDDVDALIKLVDKKPGNMAREDWLEARREAARKLGRAGDKKAVPVLIRAVETEKFDVLAEIAIEALGRLRDERAVPVLRAVTEDSSRDRYVRDAAKKALRRIGVDPGDGNGKSGGKGGGKKPDDGGDDSVRVPHGGSILGDDARHDIASGPVFGDEVLAASERFTFAAGDASLTYDTERETAVLTGDVSALYEKVIEKQKLGYSYGGDADLAFGVIDLPGDDTISKAGAFSIGANGEARMFLGGGEFYVQGQLAAALTGIVIRNDQPGTNFEETLLSSDLAGAIGGGWGRIFDVGEGLRLRRLEHVLAKSRMLGRPIGNDLARKILRAWWALRGEQGAQRRLLATVAILRDAGVLLGEPDAGTTYKILQVLLDGQLDHRLQGLDIRVGASEAYLMRDDESPAAGRDGRHESVFSLARYGRQNRDGLAEIVGSAFATYEFGDEAAGELSPWALSGQVAWRRFLSNSAFAPIGALEFTGRDGLPNSGVDADMNPDGGTASRLGGTVGWLWSPNRASHYRLAGSVLLESGEMFLGISFDAAYGLLDAGFVGGGALPAAIK
jgi:hypothetical protein